MGFDVTRVRASYPALAEGYLHFDGAGGTQMCAPVADAVAATLRSAVSNRTSAFPSGRRANEIVSTARDAVADLLGADPDGVVFGSSATSLTYSVARALAKTWRTGDEVVVSRLDHDANVRPWVQTAAAAGATVRFAEFDPSSGELPVDQYADLVTDRTRLVAVTGGSNAVGTRPDVAGIAKHAGRVGALVYVDGVHATPHAPVDVAAIGADFYVTSAYKWSGPHLATCVAAPSRWEPLRPDKLTPSPDTIPDRFEAGTHCFELLAGLTAAVDHLAGLDGSATGNRRERLVTSMRAVEAYEKQLFAELYGGLAAIPGVVLYGKAADRCPTVSFQVGEQAPDGVADALGAQGICVFSGNYYAYEYFEAMGLNDTGGAVRASVYHYNTSDEVRRLLAAVARLAG